MNSFQNCVVVGADTSVEVYRRQDVKRGEPGYVMSRGALCDFNECPSKWLADISDDETKSTAWGDLIDCLVLTPDEFENRFAISPETYPAEPKKKGDPIVEKPWNRNANFCKEWEAKQAGKKVLTPDEFAEAQSAIRAFTKDSELIEFITGSQNQVMVTGEYHDRATGLVIPMKALIDVVPSGRFLDSLGDLKTGQSAAHWAWKNSVEDHFYDVQAAMYLDMWNKATGEARDTFRHLIQESSAPYQTARRIVSQDFLQLARSFYLSALARYCRCLDSGIWPDYEIQGNSNFNGWTLIEPDARTVSKRTPADFTVAINVTSKESREMEDVIP